MNKIQPHKIFEIYQDKKRIYTKSIYPGKSLFQERLIQQDNEEYREFDPTRSKLAATIMKGCTNAGIRKDDTILYLGISHGYTASFVSDVIGKEGIIFGIDPAPRVIRDLIFISEERKNIVPILADANHPEQYVARVSQADIVFQDIAQRNQAEIFIKNCKTFLKEGGYGLLAVKARSIDIKRKSKDIFVEIRKKLEDEFTVIDYKILDPFEKDHCMIIIKNQKDESSNSKNISKESKKEPAKTKKQEHKKDNNQRKKLKKFVPPNKHGKSNNHRRKR